MNLHTRTLSKPLRILICSFPNSTFAFSKREIAIARDNQYSELLFLIIKLIYLFLVLLCGLHCCVGFSLVVLSRGDSPVTLCWLLTGVTSLVEHRFQGTWASPFAAHSLSSCGSRLRSTGLIVVARALSCSDACGISADQGQDPCLLHWQTDSLPLSHQGSPYLEFLINFLKVQFTTYMCFLNNSCLYNFLIFILMVWYNIQFYDFFDLTFRVCNCSLFILSLYNSHYVNFENMYIYSPVNHVNTFHCFFPYEQW